MLVVTLARGTFVPRVIVSLSLDIHWPGIPAAEQLRKLVVVLGLFRCVTVCLAGCQWLIYDSSQHAHAGLCTEGGGGEGWSLVWCEMCAWRAVGSTEVA